MTVRSQQFITPSDSFPHAISWRSTGKKPEGRKRLGFIKVDVGDVVENRRITDTWSLMDSEQGEIQLKLEWMPLQLAEV